MTSQIEYQGDLRTKAVHIKSGETFITDAPTDNSGKGEAFSPTDLLATSLANCMLTIMAIVANKKNIKIEGAKAQCIKVMANDPRRVSEIQLKIFMPGENIPAEERNVLENAALNCPVAKSIHPDINQVVEFIYQ